MLVQVQTHGILLAIAYHMHFLKLLTSCLVLLLCQSVFAQLNLNEGAVNYQFQLAPDTVLQVSNHYKRQSTEEFIQSGAAPSDVGTIHYYGFISEEAHIKLKSEKLIAAGYDVEIFLIDDELKSLFPANDNRVPAATHIRDEYMGRTLGLFRGVTASYTWASALPLYIALPLGALQGAISYARSKYVRYLDEEVLHEEVKIRALKRHIPDGSWRDSVARWTNGVGKRVGFQFVVNAFVYAIATFNGPVGDAQPLVSDGKMNQSGWRRVIQNTGVVSIPRAIYGKVRAKLFGETTGLDSLSDAERARARSWSNFVASLFMIPFQIIHLAGQEDLLSAFQISDTFDGATNGIIATYAISTLTVKMAPQKVSKWAGKAEEILVRAKDVWKEKTCAMALASSPWAIGFMSVGL